MSAVLLVDDEAPIRDINVAIVLATAADTVPPSTSLRKGVVAYVLKPFVREQVLAAVAQAIAFHESAVAQSDADAADPIDEWLRGKPDGAR